MKRLTLTIALTLALLAFTVPGFAAGVQLGWDANAETDLEGYRVFQRDVNENYDYSAPVAEIPAGTETCTLTDIPDGDYRFVLRAFDASGNESGDSNEVALFIDQTPPAPPTGFWGIIKQIISWLRSQFGFHARVV